MTHPRFLTHSANRSTSLGHIHDASGITVPGADSLNSFMGTVEDKDMLHVAVRDELHNGPAVREDPTDRSVGHPF